MPESPGEAVSRFRDDIDEVAVYPRELSPSQVAANEAPVNRTFRIGGLVQEGTLKRDGLKVQARISLPTNYQPGTRVPAIFWDYPNEHSDAKEYERDAIRPHAGGATPADRRGSR